LSGLNQYSIGIIFIKSGKLTRSGNQLKFGSGTTYPDEEVFLHNNTISGQVTGWHRYTEEQVQTANRVHPLVSTYPTIEVVLDHSDIAPGQKVDPEPAFPIEQMQEVFRQSRSNSNLTN